MKTVYPLEGDAAEAVGFLLYDRIGRSVWGSVRVRREKNPDVLVIEAHQGAVGQRDPGAWKPILHLVPVGDQLLQRNFGLIGGANASETADPVPE